MTIALVGSRLVTGNTGSTSSRSSSAAAHTSGNLLVVCSSAQNSGGAGSLADTAGNTWTKAVDWYVSSNFIALWYAYNITGHASNVITHTLTGVYGVLSVYEFSGDWGTSDPFANYGSGSGAGTSLATGSITIARNAVGVGFGVHNLDAFNAGTNGYTFNNFPATGYFGNLYKTNISSSEAITGSAFLNTSWWLLGAMFQEQPPSGQPSITRSRNVPFMSGNNRFTRVG